MYNPPRAYIWNCVWHRIALVHGRESSLYVFRICPNWRIEILRTSFAKVIPFLRFTLTSGLSSTQGVTCLGRGPLAHQAALLPFPAVLPLARRAVHPSAWVLPLAHGRTHPVDACLAGTPAAAAAAAAVAEGAAGSLPVASVAAVAALTGTLAAAAAAACRTVALPWPARQLLRRMLTPPCLYTHLRFLEAACRAAEVAAGAAAAPAEEAAVVGARQKWPAEAAAEVAPAPAAQPDR